MQTHGLHDLGLRDLLLHMAWISIAIAVHVWKWSAEETRFSSGLFKDRIIGKCRVLCLVEGNEHTQSRSPSMSEEVVSSPFAMHLKKI